uniref:Uncharacterized protein n=1 Tax=Avena sativa TaxID=4498 RepID=A0ACD5TN97_AVESA
MVPQEEPVVVLRCADLTKFDVPASLAVRSRQIAAALGTGERVVELPRGVSGSGVATAVAYYKSRGDAAARGEDLGEFDGAFVRGLTHDKAMDLIHAAHHLGDEDLFGLLAAERAN